MNVKELINHLSKFNPELDVCLYGEQYYSDIGEPKIFYCLKDGSPIYLDDQRISENEIVCIPEG